MGKRIGLAMKKPDLRTRRKEKRSVLVIHASSLKSTALHDVLFKSMDSLAHAGSPAVAGSESERIIYEFTYTALPAAHPPARPPETQSARTVESLPECSLLRNGPI